MSLKSRHFKAESPLETRNVFPQCCTYSGGGEQTVIHFGHEFVYCLQGLVEYEINGNVYSLEKGDILLFDAALPHRWRNPAMEAAEMLLILQTPDGSDEPVRKHFPGYPSVAHIG